MIDNYKKIVGVLLLISLVGLFLPWFFFDKNVDYANGLMWLLSLPLLGISFFTSIILLFVKKRSKIIDIINFIFLLLIPLSCIYLFFTWHILTITGTVDIIASFNTAHYGFYITFISSLIATILYSLNLIKVKSQK